MYYTIEVRQSQLPTDVRQALIDSTTSWHTEENEPHYAPADPNYIFRNIRAEDYMMLTIAHPQLKQYFTRKQ